MEYFKGEGSMTEEKYDNFISGIDKIFRSKLNKGIKSSRKGWSATAIMDEVTQEQHLTPAEQSIGWAYFTEDILGYTQEKLKELEDGWQRNRKQLDIKGSAPLTKKKTNRPPTPLSRGA